MINANTIIKELKDINYQFLLNNKNGLKVNDRSYIYKKGKIPILLSAPHAVKQCREGMVKLSDYLTGPLAIYIAQKCNCSYFVRVYNNNDDPNYPLGITLPNIQNDYLIDMKNYIKEFNQFLVIDVHGCSNQRLRDLSIWSDNYETCDNMIVKLFENNFNSFNLSVDNGSEFLGGQVTRQCAITTNAFQLEIKRKIRTLKIENYYLLSTFIDAMEKSIYDTYDYYSKLQNENFILNKEHEISKKYRR